MHNVRTAIKIQITRAEGPTRLCGKTYTFEGESCWEDARHHLYGQSSTFPKSGGYDKHDFVVTFDDGETWEGRLDCKHCTCDDPDLDVKGHIRSYAEFYAGRRRPAYMKPEVYLRVVEENAEAKKFMVEFLESYDVGQNRSAA